MRTVATTRPVRGTARPPGVVVEGHSVPDWVTTWCRRSGRTLMVGSGAETGGASRAGAGASVLVPRPLLRDSQAPQVLAAVRHLPDDRAVLIEAAAAATDLAARLAVVHAVPRSYGERSVGLDAALDHAEHLLEQARHIVAESHPDLAITTELRRAWPYEIVGEEADADLVVIGGPRGGRRDGLGLVALSAIHHAPCPVLLPPRPRTTD
jgi:nucleotide-binding universal stress UspA family protein